MSSLNALKTILVVLCILSYLTIFIAADYIYHFCSNKTTFTPDSVYQSNLKSLLIRLSSEAIDGRNFSPRAVSDTNPSNNVFGRYLCGGNVSANGCRDCVLTATEEATKKCPIQKEVLMWYDDCMLSYSNRSYFETLELLPSVWLRNVANVTEQENFMKAVATSMNDMISEALNEAKSFLKKATKVSESLTVYSSIQCMPDLSGRNCNTCLENAIADIPLCCNGKQGGRVLTPSCNIRYDIRPLNENTPRDESDPKIVFPPPPPAPLPTPHTVARPPLPPPNPGKSRQISEQIIAAITVAVATFVLASVCLLSFYCRRVRRKEYDIVQQNKEGIESLQFDLISIKSATKNFCEEYKLGEGGFGQVYKGIVAEGQEIAVKRLSNNSGQGEEEFKNEVALVAKLQHRNLVRLLGFCLGGGETLLIYEFVSNKSLDYFLFDPKKLGLLDWSTHCKIIYGIARGILYLHEDSRLRVIHRDLKASNVLLDGDMNPKISDFGMARMVGIDQTQGNTKRIVGTYGYMAPEYAMEGLYSIKSDVFSFGVLLLEILSGKKNSGFHFTKLAPSLLAYAWQLWNDGTTMELRDPSLKDTCPPNEFVRYVHIGLLCVQEDAYNRPTMSSVVLMLTTETVTLPKPKRPAFSVGRLTNDSHDQEPAGPEGCSDNGLTISNFGPR